MLAVPPADEALGFGEVGVTVLPIDSEALSAGCEELGDGPVGTAPGAPGAGPETGAGVETGGACPGGRSVCRVAKQPASDATATSRAQTNTEISRITWNLYQSLRQITKAAWFVVPEI